MKTLMSSADENMARTASWFRGIEKLCFEAQETGMTPDALDEALLARPFPAQEEQGDAIDRMVIWTEASDLYDVDPEAAAEILQSLLATSGETR